MACIMRYPLVIYGTQPTTPSVSPLICRNRRDHPLPPCHVVRNLELCYVCVPLTSISLVLRELSCNGVEFLACLQLGECFFLFGVFLALEGRVSDMLECAESR